MTTTNRQIIAMKAGLKLNRYRQTRTPPLIRFSIIYPTWCRISVFSVEMKAIPTAYLQEVETYITDFDPDYGNLPVDWLGTDGHKQNGAYRIKDIWWTIYSLSGTDKTLWRVLKQPCNEQKPSHTRRLPKKRRQNKPFSQTFLSARGTYYGADSLLRKNALLIYVDLESDLQREADNLLQHDHYW